MTGIATLKPFTERVIPDHSVSLSGALIVSSGTENTIDQYRLAVSASAELRLANTNHVGRHQRNSGRRPSENHRRRIKVRKIEKQTTVSVTIGVYGAEYGVFRFPQDFSFRMGYRPDTNLNGPTRHTVTAGRLEDRPCATD